MTTSNYLKTIKIVWLSVNICNVCSTIFFFWIETGKSLFKIQNGTQKKAENVWKYCFKYFLIAESFVFVKCNTGQIRSAWKRERISFYNILKNKHIVTQTKKSTPTVGVGMWNQNYSKGRNRWQKMEEGIAKHKTLSKTYKLLSSSFLYRTTYISREVLTTTTARASYEEYYESLKQPLRCFLFSNFIGKKTRRLISTNPRSYG